MSQSLTTSTMRLRNAAKKLQQELGREPTTEETAREADVTLEETERVLDIGRHPVSLDNCGKVPGSVPGTPPTDLEVAINVAQQLLDSDSLMSVREALRLLLRALDAEDKGSSLVRPPGGDQQRCAAAHPEDPTPLPRLWWITFPRTRLFESSHATPALRLPAIRFSAPGSRPPITQLSITLMPDPAFPSVGAPVTSVPM